MARANIVIRSEDSKNDPKKTRKIAQLFVDDKAIVGVLDDFSSTASIAAAEIYAKAGMPQLSQTASHPDFVTISNWLFRNITTQSCEGPFNARWMPENGVSKASVVAIQNDWGFSCTGDFVDAFKAKGGTVTSTEYFNPGTRDFRAILTRIDRAAPEAIHRCMFYEEGAACRQQRRQLNVAAQLFGPSSLFERSTDQVGRPVANGLFLSSNFTPTNPDPAAQRFLIEHKTKYGAMPNQFVNPMTRWASCWSHSGRSGSRSPCAASGRVDRPCQPGFASRGRDNRCAIAFAQDCARRSCCSFISSSSACLRSAFTCRLPRPRC
jgi:branched-chain amino acid transport system substrate-binding protein